MPASIFKAYLIKIRAIIWPIEPSEIKLFVPMGLMMFCILFNFGALRSIKDGLVVPSMGAEVISFLKFWLVLPATVIFTIIYIKLSNLLRIEYIFYLIVSTFLLFFLFFAYVIYPNQDFYHPDAEVISLLCLKYPNFQWFIKIIGKWSYALMYIFSELWSAVVINLMFWQFANDIFDANKAKRFYPALGMVGNFGLILAGNVLVICSNSDQGTDHIGQNLLSQDMLKPIISGVVFSGILSMIMFRIANYVALRCQLINQQFASNAQEHTTKLSLSKSFKLILQSKYIGHIVLLILGYGLLINILEGPWKSKVRELYPDTIDYINFMGRFNIWMGVSCVTFMVIGSNILRRVSWLISALVTPMMILITGLIFFVFVIFADNLSHWLSFNPIYAAVIVGATQNILSKSTKYSLFDSTKEMAYIPLSLELRIKGKAAVEVIGTKLGKSLGAIIQSSIFMLMPGSTFDSITTYLLTIFIIVIIIWLWSIGQLNHQYLKLSDKILPVPSS